MFFQNDERRLVLVLAIFYVCDVSLWLTARRLAVPLKVASAQIYEERKAYVRLEQLKYYVDRYIRGTWQFYRYGVLGILLTAVLSICLTDVPTMVGFTVHSTIPAISAEQFASVIPGLMILLYVLAVEASSWKMRLQTRRSILVLGQLRVQYIFQLRAGDRAALSGSESGGVQVIRERRRRSAVRKLLR